MDMRRITYCSILLIVVHFNAVVRSASSSSGLANSLKYKNPKLDKILASRKEKNDNNPEQEQQNEDSKRRIRNVSMM
jgi:hypothetical protein